jgi:hypothetical protein
MHVTSSDTHRRAIPPALAALALAPALAAADVIDPSDPGPDCSGVHLSCPRGSHPAALGHSSCPSVCRPNQVCTAPSDCGERYGPSPLREPTRFCVGMEFAGPGASQAVLGECDAASACAPDPARSDDITCQLVSRCVDTRPPAPPAPAPEEHHGCRAGHGGASLVMLVGFAAVALALAARGRT